QSGCAGSLTRPRVSGATFRWLLAPQVHLVQALVLLLLVPDVVPNHRLIPPQCCRNSPYSVFLRHFGINTTWYLHSHFVWLRLSISSIVKLLFVCLAAHVWEFTGWTLGSVKLLLPPCHRRAASRRTRSGCVGLKI